MVTAHKVTPYVWNQQIFVPIFLLAASLPGYKIVHNRGIDVQRSLKKIKLKNFFRNYIGNFLVQKSFLSNFAPDFIEK